MQNPLAGRHVPRATVLAIALIALALAVAVLAVVHRGHHPRTPVSASPPGASPTATADHPRPDPGVIATLPPIHGPVTDPRTGRDYCATIALMGRYARSDYGLNPQRRVVAGRTFDRRLVVIAGTYRLLARQARLLPAVSGTGAAWSALARATAQAEEKLRAVGLEVQSQSMIVALAELAHTSRIELPHAVRGLRTACGIDPAQLGVRA